MEHQQQPQYNLSSWTTHINNPANIKQKLLKAYQDTEITKLPETTTRNNRHGDYIEIQHTANTIKKPSQPTQKHTNLKAIHGIGPKTQEKLKKQGYHTIKHLTKHPKYQEKAKNHLKKTTEPIHAIKTLHKTLGPTCLEAIKHTHEIKNSETAIIDIETLGLNNQPVILIGIGLPQKNQLKLHQLLTPNPKQEKTILHRANQLLKNKKMYLTYNGRSFDIPYIQKRQEENEIETNNPECHIDLYHYTKKTHKLSRYTLNHVEQKLLNIKREVDIPSSRIPEYYREYHKQNNIGPLLPILTHNKQDITTLTSLYEIIRKKGC